MTTRRAVLQGCGALACSTSPFATHFAFGASREQEPLNARLAGDVSPVHDPCIIAANGAYHLFCTGQEADSTGLLPWRVSTDLVNWAVQGKVFDAIPQWARDAIPGTAGLWAPDISLFKGEYRIYYSCSTFGSNRSVIGLVTNATLDPKSPAFKWQDRGLVVESHRGDDYNAIDPNHIVDREGRHWLCFGSFWSGIKMIALDPASGKPAGAKPEFLPLAARPVPEGAPGAVEAPFIVERNGYYYLFASYDYCCRGVSSSYYIVAGRSKDVRGPYLGRDRKSMRDGFGTLILEGNRQFRGPGHCAILRDQAADYLVYHAYNAQNEGKSTLRISPITWTADGWPTATL